MVQDLEPFYWERKERTGLKKYFTIPKIGIYFDGVEVAEVTSPTLAEAITEAMNHGFYLGGESPGGGLPGRN